MGRLDLGVIAGTIDTMVAVEDVKSSTLADVAPMPKQLPVEKEQVQETQIIEEKIVNNDVNEKEDKDLNTFTEDVVVAEVTSSNSHPAVSDKQPEPKSISLFNLTVGCKGGSIEVVSSDIEQLKKLSHRVLSIPGANLQINGYTSSKTNSLANRKLSKDRATYVKDLLVGYGLDKEQMVTVGKGNQDPISSNDTTSGRRENRRVEIFVFDGDVADLANY